MVKNYETPRRNNENLPDGWDLSVDHPRPERLGDGRITSNYHKLIKHSTGHGVSHVYKIFKQTLGRGISDDHIRKIIRQKIKLLKHK